MIAAWMLGTAIAALFLALAAACAERVLRLLDRPARAGWTVAIAAAVTWPALLPLLAMLGPARGAGRAVTLPAIEVTQLVPGALGGRSGAWLPALDKWLVAAWALASLLLLVRLAVAVVRARRLCAAAERRAIGGIDLLVVDGECGPAVLGVLRPRIVFPRALLSLDTPLRDLVLRHEREHVRARDAWLSFGSGLAVIAMPWSPALWYMARRVRLALEIDCDRRVVRSGVSPTRYGRLLLLVAQSSGVGTLEPALVSSPSHLERRLSAMLTQTPTHRSLRLTLGIAGAFLAGAAACATRVSGAAPSREGPLVLPMLTVVPSARAASDTGPARKVDGDVYFEFQVEKQVRQLPGAMHVTYPPELKAQHVEGSVLAQFVVDETGAVDAPSIRVLKSSHADFSAAVVAALPQLKFSPAEVGGHRVKQLVQQPFTFALPKQ